MEYLNLRLMTFYASFLKNIQCKMLHSSNLSSHDVLVGEIRVPHLINKLEPEPDYSDSYTEFTVRKPKWNETGIAGYQTQTARIMSELLENFTDAAHIPALTEMCSKTLVLSAQDNFEVSKPSSKPKNDLPRFSREHRDAYANHEQVCKEWRLAGRPSEVSHPAKVKKLESQRNLQRIAREEESKAAMKNHNDLMETHRSDISKV